MKVAKILQACRIEKPEHCRLADRDPAERFDLATTIEEVKPLLADGIARLTELQQRLYAADQWAVLLIFQGMDAAGKDSVIKHVMSGINPQGCEVHAFKAPSAQELQHDFLWRAGKYLPERGRIGIFNRSHYEEVLVVRVQPQMLERQKLPPSLVTKDIWKRRFEEINAFERHVARNGTLILKFHLRISKEEQRRRFLARLEEPVKRWKFSMGDVTDRRRWDEYMAAYEDMIRSTSTGEAPWYVVPADHKHVAWVVVCAAVVEALETLKIDYPKSRARRSSN
jgi:PPK2 family polyphosphate:nucleotide phosphotransferase